MPPGEVKRLGRVDGYPRLRPYEDFMFDQCAVIVQRLGLPAHLVRRFDLSSRESAERCLHLLLATFDETLHFIARTQSAETRAQEPF
jgi:hypothetical protein